MAARSGGRVRASRGSSISRAHLRASAPRHQDGTRLQGWVTSATATIPRLNRQLTCTLRRHRGRQDSQVNFTLQELRVGEDSVAIRMPRHPAASRCKCLRGFGFIDFQSIVGLRGTAVLEVWAHAGQAGGLKQELLSGPPDRILTLFRGFDVKYGFCLSTVDKCSRSRCEADLHNVL